MTRGAARQHFTAAQPPLSPFEEHARDAIQVALDEARGTG